MDQYQVAEKVLLFLTTQDKPVSFLTISNTLDVDVEGIYPALLLLDASFPESIGVVKYSDDIYAWKANVESFYKRALDELIRVGDLTCHIAPKDAYASTPVHPTGNMDAVPEPVVHKNQHTIMQGAAQEFEIANANQKALRAIMIACGAMLLAMAAVLYCLLTK
ncbi:MAG: hypothetical protein QM802_20860 [Agriterribacter sp.]